MTPLDLLEDRVTAILMTLVALVVLPWLCGGGLAFTLWRSWESFGIRKHERFRLLVLQGLPVAGLSLLIDGTWITYWLFLSVPREP